MENTELFRDLAIKEDTKQYLLKIGLIKNNEMEVFELAYNKITAPKSRIKTRDESWVACGQRHETTKVETAIYELLDDVKYLKTCKASIGEIVSDTCSLFKNKEITMKPRIAFYVLVIKNAIEQEAIEEYNKSIF